MTFTPLTKQALLDEIELYSNGTSTHMDIGAWDVSNVTDMRFMFSGAHAFNGDISNWDVHNVTNMSYMFSGARAFNGDISNWDVHNVTNMSYMFYEARAFNGDISNWDVHNVTDMIYMFYEAHAFNGDISNWDVHNVTNMSYMFYEAHAFNGNISNWDVHNVTDMISMFYDTRAFNGDISTWDVHNVTNMLFMFSGAHAFNGDISNWDVHNVTNMRFMFSGAHAFNGDISNWDVHNVTDMSFMFSGALAFNQDLSQWNVAHVVSHANIFLNTAMDPQHIPVSFRPVAPVAPVAPVEPDHVGIAWNVHNAFKDIDIPALMAIIGPSVEYTGATIDDFIQEQLASFIRDLPFPDDERAQLTAQYGVLIPCIHGLHPPSLYNTAMHYIHQQSELYQQKYIKSFVIDSTSAYGEYNPDNPLGNRSCSKGVRERIITAMGPAGTGVPAYEALIRVLSPLMLSQINTFGDMCRTETATARLALGAEGEGDLDGKTRILRDCMRLKLANYVDPADPDPPKLTTYLNSMHDYLGGKHRKIKTKRKYLKKKSLKRYRPIKVSLKYKSYTSLKRRLHK